MRRLWISAFFAVVVLACGDMKAMLTLQQSLQAQYHMPVGVNISNSTHLVIGFQNTDSSMKWDSAGRRAFAHDVAAFTKSHYAAVKDLEDISVAFSTVSETGPLTVTRTTGRYRFAVDSLP